MAVGLGLSEFLLLVILGASPADLLSLIHADDYFQHRKIDVTVEKMIELAGKDPVDGKTQIQQLLALRVLGDDVEQVKKSPQHPAAMEPLKDIAAGMKAQEAHGFAKGYASRTLAKLAAEHPR